MDITNKNYKNKKLVGVLPGSTITASGGPLTPTKKHTRKRRRSRGWIRGIKKANGKTYYYYCYSQRNARGDYPEKVEYLGTAEKIRQAVKEDKSLRVR
ncbi:MAG: hypothetical protein PHI12_12375 [Dehalococcoidales bacterium]|jgi:hypothetical protein|nr:hypothetical protein [Dehalococcoidales bacterium]